MLIHIKTFIWLFVKQFRFQVLLFISEVEWLSFILTVNIGHLSS